MDELGLAPSLWLLSTEVGNVGVHYSMFSPYLCLEISLIRGFIPPSKKLRKIINKEQFMVRQLDQRREARGG